MDFVGYVAFVFMGLSLGLIGGGGSILTVPILVYSFGTPPVLATSYSLFIVGMTAVFGGLTYLRKGEVDLRTGFIFALPSFVGVYLTRAVFLPSLPDPVFSVFHFEVSKPILVMVTFAVLMLAASYSMIKGGGSKPQRGGSQIQGWRQISLIVVEGLVVGAVTGFVGAGGGFLIIPALVVLVGLPMRLAVGTSLFIIAAKSLIGFMGDLQISTAIDWQFLMKVVGIALIGLFAGVMISKKVSDGMLRKGFGYFVLIMGFLILLDQINRLS